MVLNPFKKGRAEDTDGEQDVVDAASEAPVTGKRKKEKPKKSNELLSSVIRESTPGAALDLVRSNEAFLVEGGTKGAIILLEADKIGGLSQRNRRDEDKGSIIELINGDIISTLATEQMLADNVFGIIPMPETLKRMYEFKILINAPYTWALVDLESEDLVVSEVPSKAPTDEEPEKSNTTYHEVRRISDGNLSIEAAFSQEPATELIDAVTDEGDEPEGESEAGADDAGEASGADDDPLQVPEDDEDHVPSDEELDAAEAAGEVGEEFDPEAELAEDDLDGGLEDDFDPSEGLEDYDEADGLEDSEVYEDDGVDVTTEDVERSLQRRLLDEELGLFVDLEAFDAFFQSEDSLVGFEIGSDGSWLGEQVDELRRQANAEIAQVHQNHVVTLGQRYMDQVARHSETVQKRMSLDESDEDAYYGQLFTAARKDLSRKNDNAGKETAEEQSRLRQKFEEDRETKARAAAEEARSRFNELYGPRLDSDLAAVGNDVLRANDAQYQSAREEILEMRRTDAARLMNRGVTRILDGLTDEFAESVQAELDLHKSWNDRILEFIDANRKNDVARSEALAEQLRQGEQADAVRADFVAQIEKAREDRARDDAERDRRHTAEIKSWQDRLAGTESELNGLLEAERRRSEEHRTHAENLAQRLENLEPDVERRVEERFRTQLDNADANREQASRDAERVVQVQKRTNLLMAIVVPLIVLVALFVGIIIGFAIFGGSNEPAAAGAILLGADGVFGSGASGPLG